MQHDLKKKQELTGAHGAQLTRGLPLGVTAGGQQLRVPFAPGCNMT